MTVQFRPASKQAAKLRLALAGPAGSGKTYSALAIASALGQPVALVDTEHGSASKYADLFPFDVLELDSFHPQNYIDAIEAAEKAGIAVLILDSLSHAWMGKDGTLDLVDKAARRSQSGNSFAAWKDITPIQNALIDRILSAQLHIIATLRVKTEYIIQTNERGRQEPKKVGLAPVQRDQVEYEFDVYGDLDQDNNLIIGKTRCSALAGQVIPKPGAQVASTLKAWLTGLPVVPVDGEGMPSVESVSEALARASAYVPTREREAVDMVVSDEAPGWQSWLKVRTRALDLGVRFEELRLPMERQVLRHQAQELTANIKAREKELADQDARVAAARP